MTHQCIVCTRPHLLRGLKELSEVERPHGLDLRRRGPLLLHEHKGGGPNCVVQDAGTPTSAANAQASNSGTIMPWRENVGSGERAAGAQGEVTELLPLQLSSRGKAAAARVAPYLLHPTERPPLGSAGAR